MGWMSPAILRILDANANRAREGLRVLEDVARFALDDAELCRTLKSFRHGLRDRLSTLYTSRIDARDTDHDVGTAITAAGEYQRQGLAGVVAAAVARVTEALRCLEECLKTSDPSAAQWMETTRYRVYTIERKLAQALSGPRSRARNLRLCVLVDPECYPRDWERRARDATRGGADCLQLRCKTVSDLRLVEMAREFVRICRETNAVAILNDRADMVLCCNADGVHLGQDDLPVTDARRILGPNKIIGRTTRTVEQARRAIDEGADYLGVGPVFPSLTKPQEVLVGLEAVRDISRLGAAVFGVSGITPDNAAQVYHAGASAVAVAHAVMSTDDPAAACARILASDPRHG